ncbi:hypothetical protein [Rubritalea sp.]|uniref:hypothetical protein n=1 Tax=Rubritalea sp. TaxID=2109375 RepID=UPI003EF58D1A
MLEQGIRFLDRLDDEEYVRKHPDVYDASIGAHYRHVIDHFAVLIGGISCKRVNYDRRARDEGVEGNRLIARAKTLEILELWNSLDERQMDDVIDVIGKVSYKNDTSVEVSSTIGRESMYVVIHGVHHFALIGVICKLADIPMPEGFGIAPSTVEHNKKLAKI